jgi:hypothetical protein
MKRRQQERPAGFDFSGETSMPTRCLIATTMPEGFRSIYCHQDGNPSSSGQLLLRHDAAPHAAASLIALGDLSALGEELGQRHDVDWMQTVPAGHRESDPRWRMCRAYGRDRGETDCEAPTHPDFTDLVDAACACGAEWLYLWHSGAWRFAAVHERLMLGQLTALTPNACEGLP